MPRIEPASIETLLQRAALEEVAGKFIDLGTRGANRHGDCPSCGALKKTRKFSISVPKQLFKCFACDLGGKGALNFLIKAKGMPYVQAVQWLADFYHFELKQEVLASIGTGDGGEHFDTSYFDQRMAEIGYRQKRKGDKGLFTPHTDGGIVIRYPRLQFVQNEPPWQQWKGEDFTRKRLHPSRVTSSQKYTQEKDSGIHIFIPMPVVELYRAGQQFDTLYIVEGEFKAFVMAGAGVPCVGIGGIDMFHRGKQEKELHPDIMELVRVGRCKSICLVHDADATVVKWDPDTEPEKDLGKKLKNFASAVTRFRIAVGKLVPCVLYSSIKEEYAATAKGIDDLAGVKGVEEVAAKLTAQASNALFTCRDITNVQWREINGYFDLNIHQGVPKAFYNHRQEMIGTRPFIWLGGTYRYELDDDAPGGGKLVLEKHPDSKLFIRVGCDHFKKLWRHNEFGKPIPYLKSWSDAVIGRDYVRKGVPNFFDTIRQYDDFAVVPGHFEDYRPEVEVHGSVLFNKYFPLDHERKPGKYPFIEAHLKHLFGEEEVHTRGAAGNILATSPAWVVYLDRWTIMLRHPLEKVVAVVCGSEERNTSKTTLLHLNRAVWQSNGAIIPNEAITDQFNSDWSDLKWAGVDETLVEKKKDQERLKTLITGFAASRRGMYQERQQSVNFITLDFTTNNLENFIEIAPDEFRYWVKRVPVLTQRDPGYLKKMLKELPHLMHDLWTRQIVHPQEDRLWFANSVIETEARKNVAKNSVGWCESEIREWVKAQFDHYQWPELYFTVGQVHKGVNEDNGVRFRRGEVSRVLQRVMKMDEHHQWLRVPFDPERRGREKKMGESRHQRWYVFSAVDFMTVDAAVDLVHQARAEWAEGTDAMDDMGNAGAHDFPLVYPNKVPQLEPA